MQNFQKHTHQAAPDCPSAPTEDIYVIDRKTGRPVHEPILGDRLLRRSYDLPWRPLTRLTLFRFALFSKLMGWYCDSRMSRAKITETVKELSMNLDDYQVPAEGFRSYNDFFTRRLKPGARPFDPDPDSFCAPADGRYHVYNLEKDILLPIKGISFRVADFLGCNREEADFFSGGTAIVARLCPADYHRFHYPATGGTVSSYNIKGRYDSVNPVALALKLPVFVENRRRVSFLELEHFGRIAFAEVGAFGVGAIVQTHDEATFQKMEEKGYFKFGGSTLVLIMPPNLAHISPDLLENSRQGFETLVRAGETIATVH